MKYALARHEKYAFERTGNETNGPDITISRTTRQSFVIALEYLTSLFNSIREIGMENLGSIQVSGELYS